jgi:hypothetical protein
MVSWEMTLIKIVAIVIKMEMKIVVSLRVELRAAKKVAHQVPWVLTASPRTASSNER